MNYFVIYDALMKKIDERRLKLEQYHRSNRMRPAGIVHYDISHFDYDNLLYDDESVVVVVA